jgi:undecaprenyl-phosphate 4-deoxy-4-formamido-L-arabinose transferase
VVVPVFDSEQTLAELVDRLERVLEASTSAYEVVLVNDGSRDHSWQLIRSLATGHPAVRGIDLMRNYGQHNALLCGIRAAQYELVVTLDDDLQNPPEEIPKLLTEIAKGYDVVYGDPERRHGGPLRNVASELIRLILRSAMSVDVARHVSAFRALRTELREGFADYRSAFVSIDVLLTWSTTRFGHVRVRHDVRSIGTSSYTVGKLLRHATDMLTGFSTLPLQLASLVGFGFTLFGAAVFLWVAGRYLALGYSVPGFPFLASIIAIFAGAQLFALGIMGEYLARIHFRSMGRPDSVVRDTVGFAAAVDPRP